MLYDDGPPIVAKSNDSAAYLERARITARAHRDEEDNKKRCYAASNHAYQKTHYYEPASIFSIAS